MLPEPDLALTRSDSTAVTVESLVRDEAYIPERHFGRTGSFCRGKGILPAYRLGLTSYLPFSEIKIIGFVERGDLTQLYARALIIGLNRKRPPSQTDGAALVVRRSQRLASRPVKASSTAAPQGIFFRRIGELPVTPTKGRKKAAQDALEHPAKRRRLADVSNLLTPSQSISMASLKASQKPASDESISAAPFKVVKARKHGARERVKRFFGM
ncbi:hypothetical protein BT96DRAFT_1023740 [Gymnopus androsaceus JB14]|uniref:Uncharacterized protein n=1 Tax=Gymnopus androsaceus JB14 TaxID=1447944 RepID=A0A6A4H1I8_9AGAR|nr:hypothetical protein BT96DRAFT_1023740 [Gymnopus androsaceus JB14]